MPPLQAFVLCDLAVSLFSQVSRNHDMSGKLSTLGNLNDALTASTEADDLT